MSRIIHELQDMTYLNWSQIRNSSGTAGSFLKAYSEIGGRKMYYKISNYDSINGITGHECAHPELTPLRESDRDKIMDGLDKIIPDQLSEKIWEMIWNRWCYYENIRNKK